MRLPQFFGVSDRHGHVLAGECDHGQAFSEPQGGTGGQSVCQGLSEISGSQEVDRFGLGGSCPFERFDGGIHSDFTSFETIDASGSLVDLTLDRFGGQT